VLLCMPAPVTPDPDPCLKLWLSIISRTTNVMVQGASTWYPDCFNFWVLKAPFRLKMISEYSEINTATIATIRQRDVTGLSLSHLELWQVP
jgi:hypothetical protein